MPQLAALGVGGIGPAPAIIALVLYALLPIVRNTAAGISGVDPTIIDAARGMGLTRRQIFCRVELPLALPVLLAGLRIVIVQTIGLAVVAALIGAGGLGTFVFEGLGQYALDLVLLGALPAILLALAADFVLHMASALLPNPTPGMIELDRVTKRYDGRIGRRCPVARHPDRRVLRAARLLGLRQVDDVADDQPSGHRRRRDDPPRRRGRDQPPARIAAPADRLRDPVDRAVSALDRRRQHRHRAAPVEMAGASRRRRASIELLELFRLDPAGYRGKYPHQLSGGEQQRVGVARALAADPELLLMDEPFAAVDPITRDALQGELARLHRATGKTIVFVTHDIEEALRLATTIAIMDKGRIVQRATPLDLLEHPVNDFVRDFVGRQGLGLKLLSVRRIADRLRRDETADGEPLRPDASLRDALSAMTARHTDRLPVADAAGRTVGVVTLADLVR